jgi:hypothetical protein
MHRITARRLSSLLLVTPLLLPAGATKGQGWPEWPVPEDAGFSSEMLEGVRHQWNELDGEPAGAFFVVFKGRVLLAEGRVRENLPCHEAGKAFLSSLFGPWVADGTVDLDTTLSELGIDDSPDQLTPDEQQATIRHLLQSRSGVYIEAACERPGMATSRPPRGSHPPGTFWHYNMWDVNALGTIFRQETETDLFRDFHRTIAHRIGMEDFRASACGYDHEDCSTHPCYSFRMSARDQARFGQLILQNGQWDGEDVIPGEWVREIMGTHSRTPYPGVEFGYMWWLCGPGCFADHTQDRRLHRLHMALSSGLGGQYILVVPDAELVFVTAVDTRLGAELPDEEMWQLLVQVLTSREIVDLKVSKVTASPRVLTAGESLRLKAKIKNLSREPLLPTRVSFFLTRDTDAIWIADSPEVRLGQREKKKVSLTMPVPDTLPPGEYQLVATADDHHDNYDLNRGNNLKVWSKSLRIVD